MGVAEHHVRGRMYRALVDMDSVRSEMRWAQEVKKRARARDDGDRRLNGGLMEQSILWMPWGARNRRWKNRERTENIRGVKTRQRASGNLASIGDGMEEEEREARGPMCHVVAGVYGLGSVIGDREGGEAEVSGPSVPATTELSPGAILGDGRAGVGGSRSVITH